MKGTQSRPVLGEALRRLRTDRNLLQEDVADRAGITRPMLSAYERGRVEPKFEGLLRILGAMGTTLSFLGTYMELVTRGRRLGEIAPDSRIWPEIDARVHLQAALDQWADALKAEFRASLEASKAPKPDPKGARD